MYNYEKTKTISVEHGAKMHSFDMPMMHTHDCHELYFLVSGERRYLIGAELYDVSPGNVVLIPSPQLHRTTVVNQMGHSRYVVYFSEEYINDFIAVIGRTAFDSLMSQRCAQLPPKQVSTVHEILRQMDSDLKEHTPYTAASLKTGLEQILLILLRYGAKKEKAAGGSASKIQEVTQYIEKYYSMDISLEDAASIACMEKTYFCKCFKQFTGFGFSEYLTRIRIQAAQKELIHTDHSVSQIAQRCGFSGSNYFGDVFRRCCRMSPSAYRKVHRL
jgi:YesN/AraC family two-component response regulator